MQRYKPSHQLTKEQEDFIKKQVFTGPSFNLQIYLHQKNIKLDFFEFMKLVSDKCKEYFCQEFMNEA